MAHPGPDPAPRGGGEGRFGSSHPGRFNAAFADGSVRAVPYSVDSVTFRNLGNKSDGQVINLDDL